MTVTGVVPPLRFTAVTVAVVGSTVSPADMKSLLGVVAVMVTFVLAGTADVVTGNVPLLCPAAMIKLPLGGTIAALVLLLVRVIVNPIEGGGGASPFRTTVPIEPVPPVTAPGLSMNEVMAAGITVRVAAMLRLLPELAVTITFVGMLTPAVCNINVNVLLPVGTVTPPETGSLTDGSELIRETNTPPGGAGWLIVTVPVAGFPPVTVPGLKLNSTTGGGSTVSVTMAEPVPPIVAVAVIVTNV